MDEYGPTLYQLRQYRFRISPQKYASSAVVRGTARAGAAVALPGTGACEARRDIIQAVRYERRRAKG